MQVRFTKSYVDRLFAEQDMMLLHHLVSVVGAERQLPEEFRLFCRLVEWRGSTRSGVWQYYEGTPEAEFERMSRAFDRFGLAEIAEQYRSGTNSKNATDRGASLDQWIDTHEEEIYEAAINLIAPLKNCLEG